jgi:hypothetical protein
VCILSSISQGGIEGGTPCCSFGATQDMPGVSDSVRQDGHLSDPRRCASYVFGRQMFVSLIMKMVVLWSRVARAFPGLPIDGLECHCPVGA